MTKINLLHQFFKRGGYFKEVVRQISIEVEFQRVLSYENIILSMKYDINARKSISFHNFLNEVIILERSPYS